MKKLTLIRHTRPDIPAGICYGQLDVEVAGSFAGEAAAIKDLIQSADILISSPLLRTKRLAEYLAARYACEWREDARLMEMHFGDWEGRSWNEISHHEIDAWAADTLHYRRRGGESASQMMQRVREVLEELAWLPQRHLVLVGHGGTIRAILAALSNVSLADTLRWQIDYGAVIQLKF